MSRISGKINLLQLHAVRKMINGQAGLVECLVIPIEKNRLFIGEKGVYLDLIAFEIEKPKEGSKDTHLVKQSFSKDMRDTMTEDELKKMPILGNLQIWSENTESNTTSSNEVQDELSDLPF
ncbi:MAG: hypothetical protein WC998_06770 [Candidatus Paceibacterota bacterium]|jgi:hypothetical protein